jgi:hypothetical protein
MIAVALSLLFGVIAFAALAQVLHSIRHGMARGRLIVAELGRIDNAATQRVIRMKPIRRPLAASDWQARLASV